MRVKCTLGIVLLWSAEFFSGPSAPSLARGCQKSSAEIDQGSRSSVFLRAVTSYPSLPFFAGIHTVITIAAALGSPATIANRIPH